MAKSYEYPHTPSKDPNAEFEEIWRYGIRRTDALNENSVEISERLNTLEKFKESAVGKMAYLETKTRENNAKSLTLDYNKINAVSKELDESITDFEDIVTPGRFYVTLTADHTNYPSDFTAGDTILIDVQGKDNLSLAQIIRKEDGKEYVKMKTGSTWGDWYVFTGVLVQ